MNKIELLSNLQEQVYNKAGRSLKTFFKLSWDILEPKKPLLYNWHHDLIIEYLQACQLGQIKRLIINIPPRYTKSNLASVSFPAWLWLQKPELRFIFTSYSQSLSTKQNMDRRALIESDWYQSGYGNLFQISSDQNAKTEFLNNKRGVMVATSMTGTATGRGCDFLIVDDPLNPKQAESETLRESANESFDRTFSTRLDDKQNGTIIVIMQRLHENDLSGHLLAQSGWEHLKIQGVSQERKSFLFPISGKIKTFDVNEILHPERENQEKINAQKISLGSYGFAGQYLQEPNPSGGTIFKRSWLKFYKALPDKFDEVILSFDMTFKETKESDFVVGQCWGRKGPDKYLIDQIRDRMDFVETLAAVKLFSLKHPKAHVKLIEDKANGSAIISTLKKEASGIIPVSPRDSKESRAMSISPEFESGNIYLPDQSIAPWIDDYIQELVIFPRGKHDDQVDATTQALQRFKHRSIGNFLAQDNKNSQTTLVGSLNSGDQW